MNKPSRFKFKPNRWAIKGQMRPVWIDSVVLVAIASAILYFVGATYLDSYYGRLGMLDTQLDFTVGYVTRSAFLPLMYPTVFLILIAILCLWLRGSEARPLQAPFFPLPATLVVAIVYVTWTTKLLMDFMSPAAPVHWLGYSRRNVLFALFAVAVLVWHYIRNWGREVGRNRWLSRGTASSLGLLLIALSIIGTSGWLHGKWPLSAMESAWMTVAICLMSYQILRDLRSFRARATAKPEQEIAGILSALLPGSRVYLLLVVGLSFVLASGLYGTVSAQAVLAGCENFKAVEFDPTPASMTANHTYWLILHDRGYFFVRDLTSPSNRTLMIAADQPGTIAKIHNAGARMHC